MGIATGNKDEREMSLAIVRGIYDTGNFFRREDEDVELFLDEEFPTAIPKPTLLCLICLLSTKFNFYLINGLTHLSILLCFATTFVCSTMLHLD